MKKNYKPFVWYPVTDDMYWLDDMEKHEIVIKSPYEERLLTESTCHYGWGTMCKTEGFMFMIINKE